MGVSYHALSWGALVMNSLHNVYHYLEEYIKLPVYLYKTKMFLWFIWMLSYQNKSLYDLNNVKCFH